MRENKHETTIAAFEARMELRRRMLDASGISLPDGRLADALYAENCKSIIDCYNCFRAEECKLWLNAKQCGQGPPDFCKTRGAILRMQDLLKCR